MYIQYNKCIRIYNTINPHIQFIRTHNTINAYVRTIYKLYMRTIYKL